MSDRGIMDIELDPETAALVDRLSEIIEKLPKDRPSKLAESQAEAVVRLICHTLLSVADVDDSDGCPLCGG